MNHVKSLVVWRVVAGGLLFLGGVVCLLLLNGQQFTNSLCCLGCWGIGILFVLLEVALRDRDRSRWSVSIVFLILYVSLFVYICLSLPRTFQLQQQFNRRHEENIKRGAE